LKIERFGLGFGLRFCDRDSEQNCGAETSEDQEEEDWGGNAIGEVETAAEKDDDSDAAGGGESDRWAAQSEETKKNGSKACDRDEEQGTPEERLDYMEERSWRHVRSCEFGMMASTVWELFG
jgi:hypothetical protein